MKCFIDTETTGKADMRGETTAEHQPNIVQFSALLTEDDGTERGSMDVIIKPNGWTIPKEAADIHGITTEIAERSGIQLASALALFSNLLSCAGELVAHNIEFDTFVIHVALFRIAQIKGSLICAHRMSEIPKFCTMKAATPVCKLPGLYGFKWPKLTEAHKRFFGTDLEGAHDAMTDLRACARIYFELQKLNAPKTPDAN